ncbi:MAG: hypothetical protein OXF04_12585, partial [bacterium]|nr:hypothetical protein [bacterium]
MEVAVSDCSAYPAVVHGEPHQTFPFDSNGNGIYETCAYPGQIPHTHSIGLVSHTHTYYPYDRAGSGCTHSHQPPTGTAHWAAGSCQAQVRPPPRPDASPPPFPPTGAGSRNSPVKTPAFRSPECSLDMFDNNDYVVCYEARSPTVVLEHHNLWRNEELAQGRWVIASWAISSCGLGQGEPSNCGHTPSPGTLTRRQIWHTHADSQTWERLWVRVQRDCVPQPGEHNHGPAVCEPNHPPVPSCVPGLADDQTQTFAAHDSSGNNTTVQVQGCDPPDCDPDPGEHAHGPICEPDHPPVPSCVPGLADDQTRTFAAHDSNGDNITVEVPGCDPAETDCEPQPGEHKHGSVCEPDHPPAPDCVRGLPDTQTRQYTTHDEQGRNTTVQVPGCDTSDCVPGPGEHAHGPACEPDHPPTPPCVPGLPDTQSAQYTAHDEQGQNITVQVPGCDTSDCTPQPGEHAHGPACEPDHPLAPPCVPGLPDTQSRQYTAHNQAGQNIAVAVPGCVPTTVPPPTVDPDPDDPVCDANWPASQLAVLGSRVRWESYLGAGDRPPTPEIPGGSVFAIAASDIQDGTRYPAWTWLAMDGTRLNRGTLDVNDQRQGHECHWEAVGVRVEMRELIPSGGGDTEMRALASQGRFGAAQALATAISTWDSWTPVEKAAWAAAFAPARQVAAVWCDDYDLPVQRPLGDREPSEETRRTACRWEVPRKGIWEWRLRADYLSDQRDRAVVEP